VFFERSINGVNDKILYSKVAVYFPGIVELVKMGQFSSSCDVDITWFPFDEQTCEVTFMSWDDGTEVQIFSSPEDSSIKEVSVDGEWRIVGK
jgi:nicotinic acetylcholine receptor, invertebrate